jgi:hypothetical protein
MASGLAPSSSASSCSFSGPRLTATRLFPQRQGRRQVGDLGEVCRAPLCQNVEPNGF